MNSHLTRIALANDIRSLPEWKHTLADHIGALAVFYRFRSARIDGEVLWVDDPQEFEWIMKHHQRDIARVLGIGTGNIRSSTEGLK